MGQLAAARGSKHTVPIACVPDARAVLDDRAARCIIGGVSAEGSSPQRFEPSPATRPLLSLPAAEIRERFERALEAADGVLGAHCIHELWMRNEMPLQIEGMIARLWERAAPSIPHWLPMQHVDWLPRVYEVAGRFQAQGRGRSNLYLVLLDYSDSADARHGLYVGMSRYAAAERFDQHKAGIRAAGSVLKRGLEVLTGPVMHLQRIRRSEAERIETELAEALAAEGIRVKGGH